MPQAHSPNTFLDHLLLSVLLDVSDISGDVSCKSTVYVLHCSRQFILLIQMTLYVTLCRGMDWLSAALECLSVGFSD